MKYSSLSKRNNPLSHEKLIKLTYMLPLLQTERRESDGLNTVRFQLHDILGEAKMMRTIRSGHLGSRRMAKKSIKDF